MVIVIPPSGIVLGGIHTEILVSKGLTLIQNRGTLIQNRGNLQEKKTLHRQLAFLWLFFLD